jgi:hypothetical protein
MAAVLTSTDRRRAPRRKAPGAGLLDAAVLRPGVDVVVVAISAVGALVETSSAVRPGIKTELTLEGLDGRRSAVVALVLRCWVSALEPLRYRAVVSFERPLGAGSG